MYLDQEEIYIPPWEVQCSGSLVLDRAMGVTLGWVVLCSFRAKQFQLETILGTYGKLGTRFTL